MFQTQNTTVETKVQAPVFMLDLTGELVNEPRRENRSCDGKWLKKNCKLNTKPVRRFLGDSDDE